MTNEYFIAKPEEVDLRIYDKLLSLGFRHFSDYFFRYSHSFDDDRNLLDVVPVRINLCKFRLSKSKRRVIKKNNDLFCRILPVQFTQDRLDLFEKHKQRYKGNIPENLANFLSDKEEKQITHTYEIALYLKEKLIASSFFDIAEFSTSAIYAMFDPDYSERSLGTLTLLLEINKALELGFRYHYLGYTHLQNSAYDYKKNFIGLEKYDFATNTWADYLP